MFSLRQSRGYVTRIVRNGRALTTQEPLIDLAVDNEGIATLTLQRAPVNMLNLDLLKEISKSLDDVAKNKSKAMILTSATPNVFSAGLDIKEMYKPDLQRAAEFWLTLQDVWMKLFGSTFITAAAINGHAPAGGCLLSMSCEYRAMVSGKFTIGLNETAMGVTVPSWFMDTMCHTIPIRQAELALTAGKMFTVEEALKIGLIDEVAIDKNDAVAKCKAFVKKFDGILNFPRSLVKQKIRATTLQRLKENRQADLDEFLGYVQNSEIQQILETYLQTLKNKARR